MYTKVQIYFELEGERAQEYAFYVILREKY